MSQAVALLILGCQTGRIQLRKFRFRHSRQSKTVQSASEDVQQSELPNPEFRPHGPFQGPIEIPHIARFNNLPMRMFLEPHLISPGTVDKVDSSFVELFDKTLREFDDDELLETAALSLARIAHEKLNSDLSAFDRHSPETSGVAFQSSRAICVCQSPRECRCVAVGCCCSGTESVC